ncbi:MAG: hypothetical protein GXX85_00745 [Ignavibacteria bacterium]|nr:hypothetical protein [Ignavibacteria bacterium]
MIKKYLFFVLFFMGFSLSEKIFSQSYMFPDKIGFGYGYSKIVTKYDGDGHSGLISFGKFDLQFGYSETVYKDVNGYSYAVGVSIYRFREGKKIYPALVIGYAGTNHQGGINLGLQVSGDLFDNNSIRIIPEGSVSFLIVLGENSNSSSGYGSEESNISLKKVVPSINFGINIGSKLGKSVVLLMTPGFSSTNNISYFHASIGLSFGLFNNSKENATE